MSKKINVYFMGAGEIALPILEKLVNQNALNLVGIATQVDRIAGRGGKKRPTPVGALAEKLSLEIDKVESVNAPEYIEYLRALEIDILLVVSFGQILREEILKLPKCACVNVHASILPKYRGSSPIVSAIANGDSETGVAFMQMDRGLDTGGVYCTKKIELDGSEYAEKLELDLGELAADCCVEVLTKICNGELQAIEQNHEQAIVCKKIKKSDGTISWTQSATEIERLVRAYYPWPGAVFEALADGNELPITIAEAKVRNDLSGEIGEILQCDKRSWIIACGDGALELLRVKAPGKREMAIVDFLNGFRNSNWHIVV